MAADDFIIDINVDQRGAQIYSDEMERGAQQLRDINDRISRISIRGMRIASNGRGMSDLMRREAERRRRDARRVIEAMRVIEGGLQKAVVKEVKTDLQRPGASSGALAAVTASDRNAGFSSSGGRVAVGVGKYSYLYHAGSVRYALAIEGGSTATLNRQIVGLWFASTGRPTGFGRPTRTQRFVSMRAAAAAKILVASGRKNFRLVGIVHEPIFAHHDYKLAVDKYQPRRRTAEAIRRIYGF